MCGRRLKLRDNITLTALLSHVVVAVLWAVGEPPDREGEGGEGQ